MINLMLPAAALVAAYFINRLFLKVIRENAVIYAAPLMEEMLKTIPAYFLNRPIFYVHVLFGLGEAVYDYFSGSRDSGRLAAMVSLLSHSVFGALTVVVLSLTGQWPLALMAAVLCHFAWNFKVMRYGKSKN